MQQQGSDGLYLLHISAHGLIRGTDPELGRDADTGGQITYVLELARALGADPRVERIDLVTRQVFDSKVSDDYAEPQEELGPGARLVRLPFGPRRYLRKESLWPWLDTFTDRILQHVRREGRIPDAVHGHYADAGYVAARVATLLNIPMLFTGHSLGRVKRERLLAKGMKAATIEKRYRINRRIEGEEQALDAAGAVVASTQQEIDEQYAQYDNHHPRRMSVIPPGVDLSRFTPAQRSDPRPAIADELDRFLREPKKPLILALARPDPRKNLTALVKAFGQRPALRELSNLAVIAGTRDDIAVMDRGSREVLRELLELIDRYDLYGHVAYPKQHKPEDVPELYRLATRRGGVFVNPALTEPFGLTLLEAAASGLPLVATNDGGPTEIIRNCRNGVLVDPLNVDDLSEALESSIRDRRSWKRRSKNGIRLSRKHYSWSGHVDKLLGRVASLRKSRRPRASWAKPPVKNALATVPHVLISDIDNTLTGDPEALQRLAVRLRESRGELAFGIATGRRIDSARKVLAEFDVPAPEVWITAVGSEIHYGEKRKPDLAWARHIAWRWRPNEIRAVLAKMPGLRLQAKVRQREFKVSYHVDPVKAPDVREIRRALRQADLPVSLIASHGTLLDVLPVRASKGHALRYIATRWGIPLERILVSGDSGNDREMLCGETRGIVVGNYSPELESLRDRPDIYFAEQHHAAGVAEGLEHYGLIAGPVAAG